MDNAILVSHILLWIVVLILSLLVLALVRQVGALQARIAPVGALVPREEPRVGELAPTLRLTDISGQLITVGGPRSDDKALLIVWVTPRCPVCHELLPVLVSIRRREASWLDILLASEGELEEHQKFWRHVVGQRLPYVLSAELGVAFQVPQVPYAVLIDGQGVVRAKGLVNTREHVESLFEAMEQNVATVQDFLARTRAELSPRADLGG